MDAKPCTVTCTAETGMPVNAEPSACICITSDTDTWWEWEPAPTPAWTGDAVPMVHLQMLSPAPASASLLVQTAVWQEEWGTLATW